MTRLLGESTKGHGRAEIFAAPVWDLLCLSLPEDSFELVALPSVPGTVARQGHALNLRQRCSWHIEDRFQLFFRFTGLVLGGLPHPPGLPGIHIPS